MIGGVLSAALLAWSAAAGATLGALAFLTNVAGRWGPLRALMALLAGARPRGLDGVVLQVGPLGCGRAALGMLFLRRGEVSRSEEIVQRVPAQMPLSMQQTADLLAESGLVASGFEFQSVDQLRAVHEEQSGCEVLLLLHEYGSGALLPELLLLPFQILFRIHRRMRQAAPAVHHWALLERASPEELVLLDPFLGRVAWRRRRFARAWTGYALVVRAGGAKGRHAVG